MIRTICQKGVLGFLAFSTAIALAACSITSQDAGMEFLGNIDTGFLTNLAWSPTGNSIAVSSHNDGTNSSRVYLFDLETQEFRKALESTYGPITATGWSVDVKQILFVSGEGGKDFKPGIWTYDIDNRKTKQIVAYGDLAAWSPRGDQVAIFEIVRKTKDWAILLHLVPLDLSSDQVVYKTRGKYLQGLSWSPDGKYLVFAYSQDAKLEHVDVFVLNVTNGRIKQITTSGLILSPAWSPNSAMIAYTVEGADGRSNLYIYDMDEECRIILKSAKNPSSVAWSPDGKQIAFVSDLRGIYKLDVLSENSSLDGCR